MHYIVIDAETTVKNKGEEAVGKSHANPFHPDNKIVMMGRIHDNVINDVANVRIKTEDIADIFKADLPDTTYVGHNIKFDVHYLWQSDVYMQSVWKSRGYRVWDTQLAEYILSGQTELYAKLDKLSAKYGGTLKDDRIKEYWNAGVETEDIPKEQLEEYLRWDVVNTRTVFTQQILKARDLGLMPLMLSQMDALMATIEMEYNGMFFNKEQAERQATFLSIDRTAHADEVKRLMVADGISDPNPSSNDHISLYMFGGIYKYREQDYILDEDGNKTYYKSGAKKGQAKMKYFTKERQIHGRYEPKAEWELKKKGFYTVSDEVLRNFVGGFVYALTSYRALNKEIDTYLLGYSKLAWKLGGGVDGYVIHQSLNHVATATGRLSCTKPNLQNVSGKGED